MRDLIAGHARRVGAAVAAGAAFGFAFTLDPRWVAVGASAWLAGQGLAGLAALHKAWCWVDEQRDLYHTDLLANRPPLTHVNLTAAERRAWRDVVEHLEGDDDPAEPLWRQAW
jgi:hypothetical protein